MKDIILDKEKLGIRSDEIDVRKDGTLLQATVIDLKEIIREKNLKGLSAPQIGVPIRVFCINFGETVKTFVNPTITKATGLTLSREKCSCQPDREFIRPRNPEIEVIYQTPLGKIESKKLVGMAACVFQHQLDHLDGLLLSDVGMEIFDEYDKATEDERAELIKTYLDSLDIKQKELEKEVDEDETLSKTRDAIKFLEKVQKGEVTLYNGVNENNADTNKVKKKRNKNRN